MDKDFDLLSIIEEEAEFCSKLQLRVIGIEMGGRSSLFTRPQELSAMAGRASIYLQSSGKNFYQSKSMDYSF